MNPDGVLACGYVIARVSRRAGRRWRQGLRASPLVCSATAPEARLIAERRLCGVPETAARALAAWASNGRPAELRRDQPSPRALLARMASGRRPVSLLDEERGLDFALHDLCHLEKFVAPAHHASQVGFFAALDRAMDDPAWASIEHDLDEAWRSERDHVLADMNGAAVFLFVVLRAHLRDACQRAGFDPRPRIELLVEQLGLTGPLADAARSRRFAPAEPAPARALEDHFAAAGHARLRANHR